MFGYIKRLDHTTSMAWLLIYLFSTDEAPPVNFMAFDHSGWPLGRGEAKIP